MDDLRDLVKHELALAHHDLQPPPFLAQSCHSPPQLTLLTVTTEAATEPFGDAGAIACLMCGFDRSV